MTLGGEGLSSLQATRSRPGEGRFCYAHAEAHIAEAIKEAKAS
jgi:hypothetical protein